MVGIGNLLGAGASIFGALAQRDAQNDANAIAAQNVGLSREIQQALLELSQRGLESSLATTIDARGNQIEYDEEAGVWRSTPSDATARILSASDAEELAQLTGDAGRRRAESVSAGARRGDMGQLADSLMAQMQGGSPYSPESIEASLARSATRGVEKGFEDVLQPALRQATRSGRSGEGIIADVAKARGTALSDALLNTKIQAPQQAENLESQRIGRIAPQFQFASNFANNLPTAPGQSGQGTQLATVLANRQGGVPAAAASAGQAQLYGGSLMSNALQNQATLAGKPDFTIPSMLAVGEGLFGSSGAKDRTAAGNTTSSVKDARKYG